MRKVIRRHIRRRTDGVDLAVDVNAVTAANRGSARAESVQSTSVVQGTAGQTDADGAEREQQRDHADDTPQEEQ
jgi:hypothetical protein